MTLCRRTFLSAAPALAAAPAPHPLAGVARENLKITSVKVTILSHELKDKSWVTATMLIWKSDAVLVEVFTDKGIVGIGESSPYAGPEFLKRTIEETLQPIIQGRNPFDVAEFALPWGGSRANHAVWAGIDAACWDIIGKAKGKPVCELLAAGNPVQSRLRMYASGGVEYAWYDRPEALIDEALRHKQEGYTAFKFRIGTEWKNAGMTLRKYIPYLYKLRQAVGPSMDLMQESNMRLTLDECLELAPVLEELKFAWFEEPVKTSEPAALENHLRIKAALPTVKVSGGESRGDRFEFKEWIDRGAYGIVQPDANVTGLTEAWHIARIAALHGMPCCPHNWHGGLTTMANAALVAAIPNRLMLELNQTYNPFKEEIFADPLVVRNGYMQLPARPGFGMTLKPGLERRFPFIPGNYWKPNPRLAA
ncbi:MAG: mandelate racemase/muconate lactonizing enzyme family protein [Acidobacteria bacterium]|nr:mandelate racemase/muconate lactonizing enzyme family protein [Acidobacteriota bacterium]